MMQKNKLFPTVLNIVSDLLSDMQCVNKQITTCIADGCSSSERGKIDLIDKLKTNQKR